ncbi:MAG TPA: hypothetical protein VM529_11535 [Gemmata sp.]|nr:hypothetical protein [Gemmata sp.]
MSRGRAPLAAVVLALLGGAGCSSRGQRNEDFVPREEVARAGLDAYLAAWVRGETAQAVAGTNPPVMATDDLRAGGRRLKSYSILGQVPADAPLCFAVQLSLGDPPAESRERYVVVGIDPVWVWRYDDYLMITHWSHPMPAAKSQPKKK